MALTTWHKFEAAGNSEIGINPSFTGSPSFVPCKFNNGVDLDNLNKYVTFSGVDIDLLSIGCWFKPHSDSTNFRSFYHVPNVTFQLDVYMSGGTLTVEIYTTGSIYYRTTDLTFSADELFFLGISFNGSGAAGSRIRMWKGTGTVLTELTMTPQNDATWSLAPGDLQIGNYYSPNSIADNIKFYDTFETAWAGYNSESGDLAFPNIVNKFNRIEGNSKFNNGMIM